jgi:hypothetical protein
MTYNYVKLTESAKKAVNFLISKGVMSQIKTSRYQSQIKAVEISYKGQLDDLLISNGLTIDISDLTSIEEKNISGKYKAKMVTIKKAKNEFFENESFFIVNTFTEKGSLKTKDLAPDKLGLTSHSGSFVNIGKFDVAVLEGIEYLNIDNSIRMVLDSLYSDVIDFKSKNSDIIPFSKETKDLMALVKPQDKQAIGKDFGEIISLRWYITQNFAQPVEKFGFALNSNNPLIDFYVKHGKVLSNISAKFEAGAAPSINAIVKNIDKVYQKPTAEEKKAIDVLKALADDKSNTSTKILNVYKTLKLPSLTKLNSILKKNNVELQDINEYIQSIAKTGSKAANRIKLFKTKFNSFYTALNKTASEDSLNTVFYNKTYPKPYYSLLLSPMGYALVDYLNKTPIYQDVLNNISRSMKVEQVYLEFTTTGMTFKKKLFSKSEFKFAYGANAKDANNTGIKFSMK